MITRKKRKAIIITIIIFILLILITGFVLLYLMTDLFKGNKTLFTKYLSQNVNNIEEIYKTVTDTTYETTYLQNKYENQGQIKINYIQNLGTTAENTNNVINKLKLEISGQADLSNKYDYKNIKLLNDNNEELEVETIWQDDLYGIRFSDLFNQYTLVRNSNLKELLNNLGISNDQIQDMPDTIDLNKSIAKEIQFSESENEKLIKSYSELLNDIPDDKFTKQTNQEIKVNGKNLNANAYTLTLTKEELNNLYISFLEKIKQDEIINSKIDNIQNIINQYKFIDKLSTYNLKENYVKLIDKKIEEIKKSNIGQDETKFIIYENEKNTVKTAIITNEYEISCDYDLINEEKYLYLNVNNKKQEDTKEIILTTSKLKTTLDYQNKHAKKTKKLNIVKNEQIKDENNIRRNISFKYETSENKIDANIELNNKKVEELQDKKVLDNKNSLVLNDYSKEQLNEVLSKMQMGLTNKLNSLKEKINVNDLTNVLNFIGIYVNNNELMEETRNFTS